MLNCTICECTPLTDSLIMCSPVRLAEAEVEAVYLGPSGIFVVIDADVDAQYVHICLRSIFSSSNLVIYHRQKGRYNVSGDRSATYSDEKALDAAIFMHTTQGPPIWNEQELKSFQAKLRVLDGRNRGIYKDDDGVWYVAKNDKFYALSEHDPDHILRLTFYGGILGLHRFAIGKTGTGLLYLLTGGLMGLGWVLDLIQVAIGGLRDRRKRLIPKPKKPTFGLLLSGLLVSLFLFWAYTVLSELLTGFLGQIAQEHMMSN